MVLLSMSNGDQTHQSEVLSLLEGHHLSGVVAFPIGRLEELRPFLDRGMRMVTVDTVVEHPNAAECWPISRADACHGGGTSHDTVRRLAMLSHGDEPTDRRRRVETSWRRY